MRTVELPSGEKLPALGLGTWRMGDSRRSRASEVAAVRLALQIGYRVIDTAEMYGDGGAEEVVGEAVDAAVGAREVRREELFVVSKVLPSNASKSGVIAACERSLKRLQLDHVDLYLLHWRGAHPLRGTVEGFETLKQRGHIRHWGVSNLDVDDMKELEAAPNGKLCAANQLYYAISQRGIEYELLPWLRQRQIICMAYCPLDQGSLAADAALEAVGRRHDASASQVALAWLMAQPGVLPIPKAVQEKHLRANFAATGLVLSAQELADLDQRFPPPRRKTALAMV
jgi:diketogulonate reductase-like aldo/keto reductase